MEGCERNDCTWKGEAQVLRIRASGKDSLSVQMLRACGLGAGLERARVYLSPEVYSVYELMVPNTRWSTAPHPARVSSLVA